MTNRSYDHVIYHAGCVDGFTSAWLLHRNCPGAEIHDGTYGQQPPDIRGRVVIADFSYPPEQLVALAAQVENVTLLDHHQSAIDKIDQYEGELPTNLDLTLDVGHSGAWLTHNWLQQPPLCDRIRFGWARRLVEYVQDRDLWTYALPNSRQVTAYINATPMTWEDWDVLADEVSRTPELVEAGGLAIMRRNRILINQIKATARMFPIDTGPAINGATPGLLVPTAASPYGLGSDMAGELAADSSFGIGAYYIDYPNRREFGLRSTDTGPDVAKIATLYGGGGHPHASGFRVMRDSGHPLLTA